MSSQAPPPLPIPFTFADHGVVVKALMDRKRQLDRAAQRDPTLHSIQHELGQFARMMGDAEAARAYYRAALALKPDYPNSAQALGQMRMAESGLQEGMEAYAHRFGADRSGDWRDFPAAEWSGQNVGGARVFIWAEQGLGDVIMFLSLLPYLLAQGPTRIVVGMFPKLITLLERSFPAVNFEPLQPRYDPELYKGLFDYVLPMGELMVRLLRHYTPAQHPPVLKADPARIAMLKGPLAALGPGRKIGLSWFTSNTDTAVVRNIPLEAMTGLLRTPGCHFFSLQHHADAPALDRFCAARGVRLINDPRMEPFRDTENLAALIASMDEVISAQNANVHLAGALGVPTTLLLSRAGDFRWPENGADNPWYRSVTLLRQQTALDWPPLIAQAAEALRARACTGS